jgi:hypothetical protein
MNNDAFVKNVASRLIEQIRNEAQAEQILGLELIDLSWPVPSGRYPGF